MPVVTRQQLHRHMSEPRWTAAQEQTADELCAQVEADLEGALYGTHITPVRIVESAPVSSGDGRVLTRLPVYRLLFLDGAPRSSDLDVTSAGQPGGPIGDGTYFLDGSTRRLRYAPWTGVSLRTGWPDPYSPPPGYSLLVPLDYLGGWGPDPALVGAILRKAAARMGNRHGDTMNVSGVTANAPAGPTPEMFTADELAPLGRYRNLGWGT